MLEEIDLTGVFKNRYELKGQDWVRSLPEEDRKFFVHIGMMHNDYGRMGGIARAKTGARDERGRFKRGE